MAGKYPTNIGNKKYDMTEMTFSISSNEEGIFVRSLRLSMSEGQI